MVLLFYSFRQLVSHWLWLHSWERSQTFTSTNETKQRNGKYRMWLWAVWVIGLKKNLSCPHARLSCHCGLLCNCSQNTLTQGVSQVSILQSFPHQRGWSYRAFSLTWPASIQIYWNKRKCLHKKRVQLPQDWFGTPTWPPFHCFGTPIWPPWRHVKTLYIIMRFDFFKESLTVSLYTVLYVGSRIYIKNMEKIYSQDHCFWRKWRS